MNARVDDNEIATWDVAFPGALRKCCLVALDFTDCISHVWQGSEQYRGCALTGIKSLAA